MDAQAIHARAAAFADAVQGPGRAWLGSACDGLSAGVSATKIRVAIARAGRELGDTLVDVTAVVQDPALAGVWRACDAGRAALVLRAATVLESEAWLRFLTDAIRRGELSEQVSLLRMLPWLPDPAALTDVAVDACRTNSEPVFAAIACENPFPAAHFYDGAFDQVVIKAIFLGVSVERIVGLADRVTAETARIATDFADERRAAGRSVPADVDLVCNLAAKRSGSNNP